MSRKILNPRPARHRVSTPALAAPVFAALADETRLRLVARLSGGQAHSIAALTRGTRLTRQAITKHLRVLEGAEIVRSVHAGRENLFALNPAPLDAMRHYLEFVSQQWDDALSRLKAFVED
jgi:DNA-binding transcriptional ArsR family regulator